MRKYWILPKLSKTVPNPKGLTFSELKTPPNLKGLFGYKGRFQKDLPRKYCNNLNPEHEL